ncbi:hypothetical protein M9H77_02044 [Catharanthus roseus]|uniref:Uncharacterized protein n=1 Tax=Catharanthus roseus TaxID=4058 RepID=A0ACC0C7K8_CATRO|nr:hypothetical protein M9H77_02044 [Catharanthus roseus]
MESVAHFATCVWLIWYAWNKLMHEGSCSSESLIAHQALQYYEELQKLHKRLEPSIQGTLKVNTGVAVVESRIGIGIIVRNYLGILLIAEALTCEDVGYKKWKEEIKTKPNTQAVHVQKNTSKHKALSSKIIFWSLLPISYPGSYRQNRGCFGCCAKSQPIIAVDEPSKRLRIQGRLVKKPSISEDFWSTSTCDLESTIQSQRSISSLSVSNQSLLSQFSGAGNSSNHSEFVNHGNIHSQMDAVDLMFLQFLGMYSFLPSIYNCSWNATYETLLGTNKRFPQPIPLSEMVDFLVEIWEQEGLYD